MKLSVIGLGKLGLPMASLFASKGHQVTGIDYNETLIKQIQDGQCPILEPDLPELMARLDGRLNVTTDMTINSDTELIFLIVPTPSSSDGKFINDYLVSALETMAPSLREKTNDFIVVITSTVMPGSMENIIKPTIEQNTDKQCGLDFGLCYNPEFIALGSVLRDMSKPDSILIGESDTISGNKLAKFYDSICDNNPPVVRMSWWNAEVAKLALNVAVTTKVSIANTLAEVCEKIPNGNVDDITKFLGLDSRIGSKYLKGGLSFGGPCFPRDNRAFIQFARGLGIMPPIQIATDILNKQHIDTLVNKIQEILYSNRGSTVSFLGLTYKPDTPVLEESPTLAIIDHLPMSIKIKAYDPMGMSNAKRQYGDILSSCINVEECLADSDLCVISTQWEEFKRLKSSDFKGMRTKAILDCWRILDKEKLAGIKYYATGVNSD